MDPDGAQLALLVATATHLGFQLVVTLVVYPTLVDLPPAAWARGHAAHSRRITPAVVIVYGALVAAGWAALASDPGRLELGAVASSVAVGAVTALVAAPAHRRLGPAPDPRPLRLLRRADRLRLLAAVLAVGCAIAAVVES